MIQKKICLLGASGVGKTSLVRQFVESLFDEKYLTTIGVKVDKKLVRVGNEDVTLMLWDVAGAEEHFSVPSAYVRGAAAYLLVVDATRPDTLTKAREVADQVARDVGRLPVVLVVNKIDLVPDAAIDRADPDVVAVGARSIVLTSARTGEGVEAAFMDLAHSIVSTPP